MINSSKRKQELIGWLQQKEENAVMIYEHPLQLQKFLFFYEAFSKAEDDKYEFHKLKGYENGPVFSTVWGDYKESKDELKQVSIDSYQQNHDNIKEDRAFLSAFVAKVFLGDELINFTHKMNIWERQSERIRNGERQVDLEEKDFNEKDRQMMLRLLTAYSGEFVKTAKIKRIGNISFVFSENDYANLSKEHNAVLMELAKCKQVETPSYVTIEDGVLIID